jgi:hypothetical protein
MNFRKAAPHVHAGLCDAKLLGWDKLTGGVRMVAIRARFDGKVFVPDEAVDMPLDQRVIMHVESEVALPLGTTGRELPKFVGTVSKEDGDEMMKANVHSTLPPGTPAADLLQFVGMISEDDLKLMSEAIEESCEQVDPDGW